MEDSAPHFSKKFDGVLYLWHILVQAPLRYSVQELADRLRVSPRTIYRYLHALQDGLRAPIYSDKGRWAVHRDYYLPPIHFSIPEGLHVFLAVRLMAKFDQRYNPHLDSTFEKLASALPEAMKDSVRRTLDRMQHLPRDEKYLRVLATVAEAWTTRRRLTISYRALGASESIERVIAPYHIEPAAPGHASYVIAHCQLRDSIRVFKIDRIEWAALRSEAYEIPAEFNPDDFLGSAWGIIVEGEVETVRLRITDPAVKRIMRETIWHPSQRIEEQRDGSLIMTLEVMDTTELGAWILGWGDGMEVLDPPELRQRISEKALAITRLYASCPGRRPSGNRRRSQGTAHPR